jgi:hypothetical protein
LKRGKTAAAFQSLGILDDTKEVEQASNRKMSVTKYRDILDANLHQSTKDFRLGRRFTLQQDNNPKHTAKTTQEWLRDKSLNVIVWPSQC